MKKLTCPLLILAGCIPFGLGYAVDRWMTAHPDQLFAFYPAAFLFLLGWLLLAFLGYRGCRHIGSVLLSLHLAALTDLLVLLFQEHVLGRFYGTAFQMFYLPVLRLGTQLDVLGHSLSSACLMAFLLMVLSGYLGCKVSVMTLKSRK